MELDEDQHQIRKWVHDFAEDVMRPAGREWDEGEERPWPICGWRATSAGPVRMKSAAAATSRGTAARLPNTVAASASAATCCAVRPAKPATSSVRVATAAGMAAAEVTTGGTCGSSAGVRARARER